MFRAIPRFPRFDQVVAHLAVQLAPLGVDHLHGIRHRFKLLIDKSVQMSLAYDGKLFWISSESGQVYSVRLKDPIAQGSVEGNRRRSLDGLYVSLAYHGGFLWGFDQKRRVFHMIKITD